MLAGGGLNQSDYTSINGKLYAVNSTPRQVLDYYVANMSAWNLESQSFQATAGVGFWSRDGGNRIVWILAAENPAGSRAQPNCLWEARK
jgi:hypothetical protein